MSTDATRLKTLLSVPNELEAAMIVNALEEHGIRARMAGAASAGFRAEAPGDVAILVAQDLVEHAREVLAGLDRGDTEVDWSQVDVGEPEEPFEESAPREPSEEDAAEDAADDVGTSPFADRPFQFTLATLLIVQTALCIALSMWSVHPAFLIVATTLIGLFSLATVGTIWIALHPQRARVRWRYIGRWLTLGMAAVIFLELLAIVAHAFFRL